MARTTHNDPDLTTEEAAAAAVAELRAELDGLPAAIDAATDRGDADDLARLLVAERIVERRLSAAVDAHERLRDARLAAAEDRIVAELAVLTDRAADLDLAARVYDRAAERVRADAVVIGQRLTATRSQRWEQR